MIGAVEALTTPEGIAHWWGPDAGPVLIAETDVRVGGPLSRRSRAVSRVVRGYYVQPAAAAGGTFRLRG